MGLGAGKVKLLPSSINGRHLKMIGKSSILTGVQSMRASLGPLQLDRYLASNFTDYLYDCALAQASLKTEHCSSSECFHCSGDWTASILQWAGAAIYRPTPTPATIYYPPSSRASNEPSRRDHDHGEASYWPTSISESILLRRYAKHSLWNLCEPLFEALLSSVPLSGLPPQLNI